MSIYVATFIVVTVGTDYMLQLFIISVPELPEIKTLEDLSRADVNFSMERSQLYSRFEHLRFDAITQTIFDRIQVRDLREGYHLFCNLPTGAARNSTLDESINLCLEFSREPTRVLESSDQIQIDKIENPIIFYMPKLEFLSKKPLMRDRVEELIYKFSEVGLLDKWDELATQPPKPERDDSTDMLKSLVEIWKYPFRFSYGQFL
ncbi:hypothetical protein QAD02_005914 [Eretmocerus hayati]|uniref:Uncharacterized protein n=1 Tax=Eretmocerus hayati TaxID=131215 RepID=A0ACC2MZY5_9HYME|nr:hypothetical protein QAD02_005914 [Eretmocerus hayati]